MEPMKRGGQSGCADLVIPIPPLVRHTYFDEESSRKGWNSGLRPEASFGVWASSKATSYR